MSTSRLISSKSRWLFGTAKKFISNQAGVCSFSNVASSSSIPLSNSWASKSQELRSPLKFHSRRCYSTTPSDGGDGADKQNMAKEQKNDGGIEQQLKDLKEEIDAVGKKIEDKEAKLETALTSSEKNPDLIAMLEKSLEKSLAKQEKLIEDRAKLHESLAGHGGGGGGGGGGEDRWWKQKGTLHEDEISWKQDPEATTYIRELLGIVPVIEPFNTQTQDADGNKVQTEAELHVFQLEAALQQDERGTSSNLVVPPGTRGAWQALLADFEPGKTQQRFLLVGSPGVGKSRSINYFIREVIQERRQDKSSRPLPIIVFEHRKDSRVWLFAPQDAGDPTSEYEAFRVDTEAFVASRVAALRDPDNVYVVDSGQAEDSKMPTLLSAVTVFVCSPDTRHFSEYRKHLQVGGTFYVPGWAPGAMLAAQPYMLKDESVNVCEVQTRVGFVGDGSPRRVYASHKTFQTYKDQIDSAMVAHAGEIAGVLVHGAGNVEVDHNLGKPLSAVFSFDVQPDSNFESCVVRFVSDYARLQIGLATLKSIWNNIASNTITARNAELGTVFESVVFRFLQNGWQTTMTPVTRDDPQGKEGEPETLVVKGNIGPVQMVPAGLGLKARGLKLMEVMPSVESKEGSSYPIFLGSNFPLIDAADARNRGFSVTIALSKDIKQETVNNFITNLGLQNKLNVKLGGWGYKTLFMRETLHIVFLVPEGFAAPAIKNNPFAIPDVKWYTATIPSPHTESGQKLWKKALEQKKKSKKDKQEGANKRKADSEAEQSDDEEQAKKKKKKEKKSKKDKKD